MSQILQIWGSVVILPDKILLKHAHAWWLLQSINASNQCNQSMQPSTQGKMLYTLFSTKNQCNQSMQTINASNQCNQSMQAIDTGKFVYTYRCGPTIKATNQCKLSLHQNNAPNQCNQWMQWMHTRRKKNIHHVFDPKTAIIPKIMRNNVFRPRKQPKSENSSDLPCSTRNHPRTKVLWENPVINQGEKPTI